MTLLVAGLILVALAIAGGTWWHVVMSRANPPLPEDQVTVGRATFTVEIASTTLEQMTGLSYRTSLADGHGMFFVFGAPAVQHFWMKDMNFAIDIIWIANDAVAGFAENAQPQPGDALWKLRIYSSPGGTDRVLEVPAGTVARDGIKVGDPVSVIHRDAG